MCGIVGYISRNRQTEILIQEMLDTIVYRGPDSDGVWKDENRNVALGHKRLAILDLSETGHQPMISHSGRYIIILNGEIYNFIELKELLEKNCKINWRGSSDTEIILELIERVGISKSLELFIGMFAFALYDKLEQKIYLARDRMGEKPLYYFKNSSSFVFSSELKPILKFPEIEKNINMSALNEYLNLSYINHPHSIFENVSKLEPGKYLEFDINTFNYKISNYWNFEEYSKFHSNTDFKYSYIEAVEHLEELLHDSISKQMRTDVPFGAFLSGGVDSSLIVALMQKNSTNKINTFSIGFEDKKYDESVFAKRVAEHLGTNHTELILNNKDLSDVLSFIPKMYDEPFADSSQIPTYLVSKLAKEKVTVSLSGDGGDELFYGYNHYFLFNKINSATKGLKKYPTILIANLLKFVFGNSLTKFNTDLHINNYKKIIEFANYKSKIDKYQSFFNLISGNILNEDVVRSTYKLNEKYDFEDIISYFDLTHYLVNDILVKVDRAAMFNSLETRVPLLDKRIVEFAIQLPYDYKFRNNKTKAILRDVLYKYSPKELIERKKQGFSIPIESWLKNELREKVNYYFDKNYLSNQNIFDFNKINKLKNDYYNSNVNYNVIIWNILIFQMWYEEYLT